MAARWSAPGERLAFGALVSVLVLVAVIDTLTSRIPDRISKPSMVLAGVAALVGCAATGDGRRLAAVVAGTVLCWGALGAAHVLSPRSLGRGDVKLAVTLGVALGWAAVRPADAIVLVLGAFLCASAAATVIGVALLVRRGRSAPYPFGPSLIAGTMAMLLLADHVRAG